MSDITPASPLYGPLGGRIDPASPQRDPAGRGAEASKPAHPPRPSDRADISDRARLLAKLAELPEMREDLVAEIRRLIEAGEYETEERLDAAIEHLLDELNTL